ncbi:MAG: hypothetical protein JSV88_33560 [Candidatus Aminicenantes bacterium]|nr:MAG: hypothetical protein JSV88_33560 [Candidatus Aminicenantes bacterium]
MTVKKLFRFELEIKASINVEKVKETDYGPHRYIKQLLNEFVNDAEALRAFLLINFIDRYINDNEPGISKLLEIDEDEGIHILRVAEKCPPEVRSFFKDLFSPTANEKKARGKKGENQFNTWEPDRIFEELNIYLGHMKPVKAAFCELTGQEIYQEPVKQKESEH